MSKVKQFLRGPGLVWAVLLTATAAWSLATISARKVYSAGQVFTAADYNLDIDYWITYINQLMVKFPGDSVKTLFGSFDTLTTRTAAGVVTLKDPLWSLSASDSLKFHLINARRANFDTLGVGATGATGAGVPVGFRVAFTAGIRARANLLSTDSLRIVDSLDVSAGAKVYSRANIKTDSLSVGSVPVVGFRVAFTAGIRARANLISTDSLRIVDSLTVAPGSKTKFLPGSIFQAAAITPDSILGTVLTTGTFNIGTATNWQLGGTAYTGTMANLNTLRDDSMADALHRHSELSASGGSPNPAWSVDANGDLNPASDNVYNIGTLAASVDTLTIRAITEGTLGSGLTIFSRLNNAFNVTFSNAATSAVGKSPGGIIINFTNQAPDDNSGYFIQAQDNAGGGTARFKVWADGDVQNHDNSYGALSDSVLKTNIEDAPDLTAALRQVRVREYEFKDEPGKKSLGVVAQEVQSMFPKLVSSGQHFEMKDGTMDTLLAVNYMGFVMPLVQSNQKLWARIDSLEEELKNVKAAQAALGARVLAIEALKGVGEMPSTTAP